MTLNGLLTTIQGALTLFEIVLRGHFY